MSETYQSEGNGVTADEYFAIVPESVLFGEASDGAVRLYCVLYRHANNQGLSHPSRSRLAKLMRCSVDTVDRRVEELRTLGLLNVGTRFGDSGQRSNTYRLRLRGRKSAAPPLGTDAAPGGRTDAAQNQSHVELEPTEPDTDRVEQQKVAAAIRQTRRDMRLPGWNEVVPLREAAS
jgi:DNA-binding transcriptional MocR family regulator